MLPGRVHEAGKGLVNPDFVFSESFTVIKFLEVCTSLRFLHFTGEYMNVATRGLTDEDEKVRQGAVMHVEEYDVEKPDPAYMTVDAAGVPAAPYQVSSSV